MAASNQNEYKITVLGGGGVGKSALTIRLITGTYEANYDPTIEDSYRKQVTIDNQPALMDILDTAGQEEYAALQDQWIREGDGFLIVYAINDSESFGGAEQIRNKIIRILDVDESEVPLVLVGNKCDLSDDRKVKTEEAESISKKWKCPFYEASAKEKINIEKSFYEVVREIRKRRKPVGNDVDVKKKSGFCNLL